MIAAVIRVVPFLPLEAFPGVAGRELRARPVERGVAAGLSWKARTESAGANTNPEELLAASHASCFAMALSNGLAKAGKPPQKLEVTATVMFGPKQGGGFAVQESALEVRGAVRGIDAAAFQQAAEAAKDGCPISQALKSNVKLSVRAQLEGA